jgi:beta-xylosidase
VSEPARRRSTWRPLIAGVLVLSLVAACGGDRNGASSPPGSAAPSPGGTSAAPSAGTGSGAPSGPSSGGPGEFTNPVIDRNFADPFVLKVDDEYVAYATGNLTFNIQVTTSPDLVSWSRLREALPRLPNWQPSSKGLTWAPEVLATDDGFVMHYTARDVQRGRQCLAVAVADEATGPFVDDSDGPLLCQYELGGSIDSSPFTDADGKRYLLWKNDGNCCGIRTRIYLQPLAADGRSVTGKAIDLGLVNDAPWERDLIEAPTLLLHEGTYYLFYSANGYDTRNYAVGYATSKKLTGPYEDAPENPILQTTAPPGSPAGPAAGPGHQSIVVDDDGELWLAYHAWDIALVGDRLGGRRALWLDELVFEGGKPVIKGPDIGPQPVP